MAARGNKILITSNPRGHFAQGVITGTPKPGICLSISAPFGSLGWHTWVPFSATSGHRRTVAVLLENELKGGSLTDAYITGDIVPIYFPAPGEELNMLIADVVGTGDDHPALQMLMIQTATGMLIAESSPESEPFQLLETLTDPVADTLAPCMYTGQ